MSSIVPAVASKEPYSSAKEAYSSPKEAYSSSIVPGIAQLALRQAAFAFKDMQRYGPRTAAGLFCLIIGLFCLLIGLFGLIIALPQRPAQVCVGI